MAEAPAKVANRTPTAAAPPPCSMPQTGTSTAAHARSMRLVSATITVMPTSTRSPRRNSQPARSCSRYGAGSASWSGETCLVRAGIAQASSSAETPKDTASTTSALAGPITATRPPAIAAPSIDAVRSTVEWRPVTRSSGTPAVAARVGIMALFAASPGPRSAPATATSARNAGNERCPAPCRSGIAPTTASEAQSQLIATRRAPTRSMIGPPSTLSTTRGNISARATRPVFSGLPVVV
jgi:hypothetical protein